MPFGTTDRESPLDYSAAGRNGALAAHGSAPGDARAGAGSQAVVRCVIFHAGRRLACGQCREANIMRAASSTLVW
jgi:hypothetical protein